MCHPKQIYGPAAIRLDPSVYEPESFEPWPVADPYEALPYWGSVFNAECRWLAKQPDVFLFASRYWDRTGCLPALGHLHFLFNRGLHAPFVPPAVELEVEVLSALCVCECTQTPCPEEPLAIGIYELISRLVSTTAHWRTDLRPEDIDTGSSDWDRRLLDTSCSNDTALGVTLTGRHFADTSEHYRWIPHVANVVGTNLDFHPLLLQSAVTMMSSSP